MVELSRAKDNSRVGVNDYEVSIPFHADGLVIANAGIYLRGTYFMA